MLSLIFPLSLLALGALRSTKAQSPVNYVGCLAAYPANYVVVVDQSLQSGRDCAYACQNQEDHAYLYSYFRTYQNKYGSTVATCACSDEYADARYMTGSSDIEGTCDEDSVSTYITASSYNFNGCYNSDGTTDPDIYSQLYDPGNQPDPESCLQQCKPYEVASMQPLVSGEIVCTCGPESLYAFDGRDICNFNSFFAYSHEAGDAISSTFAKRQMKERLIRSRNKKKALCPSGSTACSIQGSPDSFECIDTNQELESCGGCIYGEFNNQNATLGQDCSALLGSSRGGVTCSAGRCEAFGCKSGWSLIDGTCTLI